MPIYRLSLPENYGSQDLPLLLQNGFLVSGKNVFYDHDKNKIMVNATSLGSQDAEMSVSLMLTGFRRLTIGLYKKNHVGVCRHEIEHSEFLDISLYCFDDSYDSHYFGLWGYFLVSFLSRLLGCPFGYLFGKKRVPGSRLCNLASGSQMLTVLHQNSLRQFI